MRPSGIATYVFTWSRKFPCFFPRVSTLFLYFKECVCYDVLSRHNNSHFPVYAAIIYTYHIADPIRIRSIFFFERSFLLSCFFAFFSFT